MLVTEIAAHLSGQLVGDESIAVTGVAPIHDATANDITFAVTADRVAIEATPAACVLVPRTPEFATGRCVIRVDDPRLAFARLTALMFPRSRRPAEVHPTAVVHPTATLGHDIAIGPYCVVGAEAVLGDGVTLGARVSVHEGVRIGARTTVGDGAVLGGDGFGFLPNGREYEAVPHVGTLEIGEDVSIGANATIDRGTLGATRIGRGCKIDNLVHVAHNCVIGEHAILAAQTGLAGGAQVGDWAVVGGQVGVGNNARIGDKARVGGGSAVLSGKHVSPGATVWGVPARPLKRHLHNQAELNRLEQLRAEVRELGAELAKLRSRQGEDSSRRFAGGCPE